jgi:hypothetical protein
MVPLHSLFTEPLNSLGHSNIGYPLYTYMHPKGYRIMILLIDTYLSSICTCAHDTDRLQFFQQLASRLAESGHG